MADLSHVFVFGHRFPLMKSADVVRAGAVKALKTMLETDVDDPAAVEKMLREMAETVESWIGSGAVKEIFARPVGFSDLLQLMNGIVSWVNTAYDAHIAEEYGL